MPLRVEIFTGEATPASARLYVKVHGLPEHSGATVTGTVRGPVCAHSRTLQATIPLADLGPGDAPAGAAIIPDPCYWTPELPFLYRVEVRCSRGGEIVLEETHTVGLRLLGLRGEQLYLAGQAWLPRGVRVAAEQLAELTPWHEYELALWINNPDDPLCRAASETGVALVADLRSAGLSVADELARLNRWPCVVAAAITSGIDDWESLRRSAGQLLLIADGDVGRYGDLALYEGTVDELISGASQISGAWLALVNDAPADTLETISHRLSELQQQLAEFRAGGIFL